MQGHTDRATINQRRPMTPGMVALLRLAARPGGVFVVAGSSDVARIRALMDRGYAHKPVQYEAWHATEAGRKALEK